MTEVEMSLTWIESQLSNDTTLQSYAPGGVHQTFAIPGTTPPYIRIKHQGSQDQVVFGGGIAYTEMRFRAEAVGPVSSLQAIQNAEARIKTLLTIISPTSVTGGTIISSYRDQPTSDDEYVDGAKWHVSGGEYKVRGKAS